MTSSSSSLDFRPFTPIEDEGPVLVEKEEKKKPKPLTDMTDEEIHLETLERCKRYAEVIVESRESIARLIKLPIGPAVIIGISVIAVAVMGKLPKEIALYALMADAVWAIVQVATSIETKIASSAEIKIIRERLRDIVDRLDADPRLQDAFLGHGLNINEFRE